MGWLPEHDEDTPAQHQGIPPRRTRKQRGSAPGKKIVPLAKRWPVERTNARLADFGQLRRNTNRTVAHRLAQLALAIVVLITAKLIDWQSLGHRIRCLSGDALTHGICSGRIIVIREWDWSREVDVRLLHPFCDIGRGGQGWFTDRGARLADLRFHEESVSLGCERLRASLDGVAPDWGRRPIWVAFNNHLIGTITTSPAQQPISQWEAGEGSGYLRRLGKRTPCQTLRRAHSESNGCGRWFPPCDDGGRRVTLELAARQLAPPPGP